MPSVNHEVKCALCVSLHHLIHKVEKEPGKELGGRTKLLGV